MPLFGHSRRSVQVAPRQSIFGKQVVIKQEIHSFFCYFIDINVEHEFQAFFRRERQAHLILHMFSTLVLSILVLVASAMDTLTTTTTALAASLHPSGVTSDTQTDRVKWLSKSDRVSVVVVLYVMALLVVVVLHNKKSESFYLSDPRVDPVQLLLFIFYQFLFVPVVLALASCIDVDLSFARDLKNDPTQQQRLLAFLGVPFVDLLFFYLLMLTSLASCVLRMQFTYFIVVVIQFVVITSAVCGACFGSSTGMLVPERWSLYVAFVLGLLLAARSVWENELHSRREFLSHSNLLNENRRLSHQNIEMKEELTGKLSYQLHYEMGDILRILCQIKLKMSPNEKKEIDKIITALVTNADLFEVSFDPSMTEHEEEVQGWLQMMAFKEAPPAFIRSSSATKSGMLGRKATRRSALVTQSPESRSTQSRKMSLSMTTDLKGSDLLSSFFTKDTIAEDREELSRWLIETIRDEVYVDMFQLERRCSGPMQAVFVACIQINDFDTRLSLDMKKISMFAAAVENHYFKRNPYHNCLHAGAVIVDLHFYMRRLKLNFDDTTFFVGLVAAAAHDISHPGVSNGFLITTKSKLAITYSDDSVLERMHIAELYRILSHEKYDIFSHMDASTRSEIRKLIIQMILATDLSRHFQHISKLKSRKFAISQEGFGLEVSLIMETIIMLADLGHTVKPFDYHQIWANRISEEFFRQGEAEERQNIPVSPLCDRRQANLPRSQVAFLTLLATPLFETAGEAFAIDEYDMIMKDLRANIKAWQSMIVRSESTDGTMSVRSTNTKSIKDKTIPEEASPTLTAIVPIAEQNHR